MKVRELIQALSKIEDQDLRVMTSGYEGGFDDLETKANNIQFMALDVNKEWYYGKHEPVDNLYDVPNDRYEIVKAIIL